MNPSSDTRKNGEGLVVTEGNRRTSGDVHQTPESAAAEATARKKQLQEKAGAPAVEVKQQIFG